MRQNLILTLFIVVLQLAGQPQSLLQKSAVNKVKARKDIEVRLSFPYEHKYYKFKKSSLPAVVTIINHTDTVASFFVDKYEWGYYNISFEVYTPIRKDTFYRKLKEWDKNIPAFTSLFPGDSIRVQLDLFLDFRTKLDRKWNLAEAKGTSIRAIYCLKEFKEIDGYPSTILKSCSELKDYYQWQKTGPCEKLKFPIDVAQTFTKDSLCSNLVKIKG